MKVVRKVRWYGVLGVCAASLLTGQAGAQKPDEPIAVATPTAQPVTKTAAAVPKVNRPLTCTINLVGGASLQGTIMDLTELDMKTSFGAAKMPLSEVSAVKLAGEGQPSSTIVLHNGDSITGACEMDHLTLETEWGKAEINGSHIVSVMLVQGVKWVSETTPNGSRWKLADDKPEDKKPAVAGTSTTTSGTRVISTSPGTTTTSPGTTVIRSSSPTYLPYGVPR